MNGQLSEHPLAELISEILEKGLSGALRVVHERVKAVVYFDAHDLVYATSNLRSLRLSEQLQKRGVPARQITAIKEPGSDLGLAAALLSNGGISKEALEDNL